MCIEDPCRLGRRAGNSLIMHDAINVQAWLA